MSATISKRLWAIIFIISLVSLFAFLVFLPEWCWVIFPPLGLSAVMSLDMI